MDKFRRLVFMNNKTKYLDGKEVDKFIIGDYELEFAKRDAFTYVDVCIKFKKIKKKK